MSQLNLTAHVLDELRTLVAARWEDRLNGTMAARLETIVREEPGACDTYIRMMCMHAELYQFASVLCPIVAEPSLESDAIESQPQLDDAMVMEAIHEPDAAAIPANMRISEAFPPDGAAKQKILLRNWTKRWTAAAAVLLVSTTALILIFHQLKRSPIAMGASFDAAWAGATPVAGDKIQMGVSRSLTSGYVELTSADGLAVVIQGPATFTVQRAGVIALDSGKLTASVPPKAHGFTVNTPTASIVDLGTEFGVNVTAEGETEVQTFRGTVSLSPSVNSGAPSSATLITAGFAKRVSPAGQVGDIPPNKTDFVRTAELEDWKAQSAESSYRRWQACSERIRHDTDLVAYYTFESTSTTADRLSNLTSDGSSLDGILGGDDPSQTPSWTTGRWPQKGALEFAKDTEQRVEIPSEIGGPLDFSRGEEQAIPFTICLWISGNGDQPFNSSIFAKGIGYAEQFVLHNFGDGRIRAWVRDSAAGERDVDPQDLISDFSFSPEWQMLAFDYDPNHGQLKLYRNGVLIASRDDVPRRLLKTAAPLVIGSREGDRHSPNADGTPSRFTCMSGRIDELAIFRRSLSAEQLREIYLAEKPD